MAIEKLYTFNHLVDSYRNTISEWAVGFRYGNFTLKLIFGGEEIPYLKLGPFRNPIFMDSPLLTIFTISSMYHFIFLTNYQILS